jgi:hypothetical protein
MLIIEKEFNVQTGEETITEREMTAAESKTYAAAEKVRLAQIAAADAKAAARQAVLEKLGLTAEEVAALLG